MQVFHAEFIQIIYLDSFIKYRNQFINLHNLKWFFQMKIIDCFSNKINICLFKMPNFKTIWRWLNYSETEPCKQIFHDGSSNLKNTGCVNLLTDLVEK